MKFENGLLFIFLICALLFGADYMGWLPRQEDSSSGQATAVPMIIQVVMPTSEAVATPPVATPETVIIAAPATWTAVPSPTPVPTAVHTPLPPSTGLLAIVAQYGETAVQRCMAAMAAGELLDLQCRTIALQLEAVAGQGGGQP